MGNTLIRRPELSRRTARSRSAVYQDISDGVMVPPIHWGKSAMWPTNEVDAIIAARIAGRSDDEIRALVAELVEARSQADKTAAA